MPPAVRTIATRSPGCICVSMYLWSAVRTATVLSNDSPRSSTTSAIVRAMRIRLEARLLQRDRRLGSLVGGRRRFGSRRRGARRREHARLVRGLDVDGLLQVLLLPSDRDLEVGGRQVGDVPALVVGDDRIDGDEVGGGAEDGRAVGAVGGRLLRRQDGG